MIHRVSRNIGGKEIQLETGLLAKQAHGAVVVSCGGTKVLAAVTYNPNARPDQDFFPLTVDYREMNYAAGKIPGSFFRREAKPSEREVLVSRLIDRPIRPQFPEGFRNEVNVAIIAISFDGENESDNLAQIAASAAISISEIPMQKSIGSLRVGYINGEYVAFPLISQMKDSLLDLTVSGTREGICMVEAGSEQLDEETVLGAIEFGHEHILQVLDLIDDLVKVAGKEKIAVETPVMPEFYAELCAEFKDSLMAAASVPEKLNRRAAIGAVKNQIMEKYIDEDADITDKVVGAAFEHFSHEVLREKTLTGARCDGRDFKTIRPITVDLQYLPNAHGSAIFTRGETQALATCTLGTFSDEILIDGILETYRDRFILHYNFPAYSVGESWPNRGPKRREIGHGALARRALRPVLPKNEEFPYTVRLVSDIMESNGSSSMATVCGGCLSMMDAGVPITAPVAGIAMGLLVENGEYHVLSDILGDEDHFGDMDFKVAGTAKGITALQMDIKVSGIPTDVMKRALAQAHEGRMHILGKMSEAISEPREKLSENAPQIVMMRIPVDMIGKIIGPGGKIIRGIQEETGAKIEIDDDGLLTIAAVGSESLNAAKAAIDEITFVPDIGGIYDGVVVSTRDFGAFVKIGANVEGMCHVSELADAYVRDVNDAVRTGDKFRVKVLEIDKETGKIRLSRKQALIDEGVEDPLAEKLKELDKAPRQPRPSRDSNRHSRQGGHRGRRDGGGGGRRR